MARGSSMPRTRRKRKRTKLHEGPSIADFYRAKLSMPAHEPGEPAPTYQDYLNWRATL